MVRIEVKENIDHYMPSQDEITLMEDILNLVSVIFDKATRWYDTREAYQSICSGLPAMVVWEEPDGTHYTHVWADVQGCEVQVEVGLDITQIISRQTFRYGKPFERGKMIEGIVDFEHLKKAKTEKKRHREEEEDFDYDVFLTKTTMPKPEVREEETQPDYVEEERRRFIELQRNLEYARRYQEDFGTESTEMTEEAAWRQYFYDR